MVTFSDIPPTQVLANANFTKVNDDDGENTLVARRVSRFIFLNDQDFLKIHVCNRWIHILKIVKFTSIIYPGIRHRFASVIEMCKGIIDSRLY